MKYSPGSTTSRTLKTLGRVVALMAVVAMLAALPLTTSPTVDAQGSSFGPSLVEQQIAADKVLNQLNSISGPMSLSDITIDPALGPPPWTSFVPDRDPSTIEAWVAIADRIAESDATPPKAGLVLPTGVVAQDIELPFELGMNDTIGTGQFIDGFGTGGGEEPIARVVGALGSPPPEPPEPDCISVEEDGSIPDANVTATISGGPPAMCNGVIGDGDFGDSSGDVDFYAVSEAVEGDTIVIDVGSFNPAAEWATTIELYTATGVLFASQDDISGSDIRLEAVAPEDGVYYAAISGLGVPAADPFDPASGTGVSFQGDYSVMVIVIPGEAVQPPSVLQSFSLFSKDALTSPDSPLAQMEVLPCVSIEEDGSINDANVADIPGESTIQCTGQIGDGEFGETSGDFDFYAINAVVGQSILVETEAQALGLLDSFVAVYDSEGKRLGENDDFGGSRDSFLEVAVPADGTYYAVVHSFGSRPTDPFDPASGAGAVTAGPYNLTLGLRQVPVTDSDVYLVDLEVGDVISAGFAAQPGTFVNLVDPTGRLGHRSGGSPTFIYPLENPLRHLGSVGIDFVVETAGIHAIAVTDGGGPYDGEIRVKRAGLTDSTGDDAQILFLDFDGASFNDAIFFQGFPPDSGTVRTLSPLVDWLPRWGLDASDEDAVIDSIIAEVTDDLIRDFHATGINGNRDATGQGGELDLRILNSRDHDDPFGEPNVSRVIIGGSIAESGFRTIGIAQSIDPGNFDTAETALVLLDVLSGPAGSNDSTLNNFGIAPPYTMIDLIGQGVGNITAHEVGHFIGNWHTDVHNALPGIMDEGGELPITLGIGPDRVFGTADDYDNDFETDVFSLSEGFAGEENTAVRAAQAFSTGQTNVAPFFESLPADGSYTLQNERSGQFLDGDRDGDVNVFNVARGDDVWNLTNVGGDVYTLQNDVFDGFLDSDPNRTVDLSNRVGNDDLWQAIPVESGAFYFRNTQRDLFLSQVGNQVVITADETSAERWKLADPNEPVEPVNEFVGQRVVLKAVETGQFLDTDRDGSVEQSRVRAADDLWDVLDAGDGYVYLQSAVTNRLVGANGPNANVGSSAIPTSDNRWEFIDFGTSTYQLRSVDFDSYLTPLRSEDGFNVVTTADALSDATLWHVYDEDDPRGN